MDGALLGNALTISAQGLFKPPIEAVGNKSMPDADLIKTWETSAEIVEIERIEVVTGIYTESGLDGCFGGNDIYGSTASSGSRGKRSA